jgi:hypothetical protein
MADNATVAGGCPFRVTRIEGAQGLGIQVIHELHIAKNLGSIFKFRNL